MIVHAAAVDVAVFDFTADEVGFVVGDFALVFFVEQYGAAQALRILRLEFVNDGFNGDAFIKNIVELRDRKSVV